MLTLPTAEAAGSCRYGSHMHKEEEVVRQIARRISAVMLCISLMQTDAVVLFKMGAVREGFEPSVPFWGTAL